MFKLKMKMSIQITKHSFVGKTIRVIFLLNQTFFDSYQSSRLTKKTITADTNCLLKFPHRLNWQIVVTKLGDYSSPAKGRVKNNIKYDLQLHIMKSMA